MYPFAKSTVQEPKRTGRGWVWHLNVLDQPPAMELKFQYILLLCLLRNYFPFFRRKPLYLNSSRLADETRYESVNFIQ